MKDEEGEGEDEDDEDEEAIVGSNSRGSLMS